MILFDRLMPQLTEMQLNAAQKIANSKENGIVWHKIGEGKTRIALAWMCLLREQPRPLIICSPNANRQWLDEIKLVGLSEYIRPKFLSYGLLSRRKILLIDLAKYNCIVVDENWLYKNPRSKRSQVLIQMTSKLPSIGLSGSMMTAGNIEDLFGQARAMNLGNKLSKTLTGFRQQFEIETINWAGFPQRYPRKGAVEAIQRRLINNVSVYFPKEVRELRDIPVNVNPTEEQLAIKKQLVDNWLLEHENETLEIKGAAALVVKLQQVSDGFLRMSEGTYMDIKSNKLQRLKEICEELLDAGERIIVWCGFRKTSKLIADSLACKTTILAGDGNFDIFGWQQGKIPVTIATIGSGASLNDFANVRYSIFYSSTFSTLGYDQAKGRTNRKSSLQNCSYYYQLATRHFPDSNIYKRIKENKTQEEILIETAQLILKQHKYGNLEILEQ